MKRANHSLVLTLLGFALIIALSAPVALLFFGDRSRNFSFPLGSQALAQSAEAAAAAAEESQAALAAVDAALTAEPAAGAAPRTDSSTGEAPAQSAHTGARITVEPILQMPELPNGCEAVSLAITLRHLGFDADKEDIFDDCMKNEDFVYTEETVYGPDPEEAFAGNPRTETLGFYCMPGVVADAANRFLEREQGRFYAFDLTGLDEDGLFTLLDEGAPVIVWITRDGLAPRYNKKFTWTITGTQRVYRPYANLHVMVASGYDSKYVYLTDPLGYMDRMKREQFFSLYNALGQRAVAITEVRAT